MKSEVNIHFDSDAILKAFQESEFAPLLFNYNADGLIIYANKAADKLLGKKLLGSNISSVFANFDPFLPNPNYEGKLSIQLPGLHVFGVYAQINCRNSHYEAICFVDVEELLLLERRLFQTNQEISNLSRQLYKQKSELERIGKLRDEFVSILSHDLRGPLRRVHSFAEILEATLASTLDDNHREYINFIKNESKIMYQMVLDILNYEAIQSGKFKLNIQAVDVKEVIRELIDSAKSTAAEKNLKIISTLCDEDAVIEADYVKIRQVLDNLFTNCLKYAPDDGKVFFELDNIGSEVRIVVADNGVGFTDEEIATIFEPFRKGLAAGSKSDSFGFGMSIVKKIVESHSGRIEVGNAESGGAKFVLSLPVNLNL